MASRSPSSKKASKKTRSTRGTAALKQKEKKSTKKKAPTKKRAPRVASAPPAQRRTASTSSPKPKKRKRETYKERIERLTKKGYTKSQARGHAKKGEIGIVLDSKLRNRAVRSGFTKREKIKIREQLRRFFGRNNWKAIKDYLGMLDFDNREIYEFLS